MFNRIALTLCLLLATCTLVGCGDYPPDTRIPTTYIFVPTGLGGSTMIPIYNEPEKEVKKDAKLENRKD